MSPFETFAALAAAALAVWAVRDEIRDAARTDVEHIDQDGQMVVYPVPAGWTVGDVLGTLSEIEAWPVCAEDYAA